MARPRTTTPFLPNDPRTQRSRQELRQALLALIGQKPFPDITIKEIVDAAGISHPTFFRRYANKQDLLEDLATEEVFRLLSMVHSLGDGSAENSAADICNYISEHRQLWTTLLTAGASSAMRDEFLRISKIVAEQRPRTNPWLPLDLAVSFAASGMFEILAWWLRQDDDYPRDNVVAFIDALVIRMTVPPPIASQPGSGRPRTE